jgi:hypothetical protein
VTLKLHYVHDIWYNTDNKLRGIPQRSNTLHTKVSILAAELTVVTDGVN